MSEIFYRWEELKKLQSGQMIAPWFIDLHLTDVCNQNCHGCSFAEEHQPQSMMSAANWQKCSDTLMDNGVKSFAFCGGGEPTLLPYLNDSWNHIHERGCHFSMLSNGTMLKDDTIETMIKHGTFIRVSLESSNHNSYTSYKRVHHSTWGTVLNNLEKLVEVKGELGTKCNIGVKFAVGKPMRGEQHYRDGLELGRMLGVDRVTFKALRHEPDQLTAEECDVEDELCHKVITELKPGFTVTKNIKRRNADTLPQCWLNPIHSVLKYSGELYICCYYYWRHEPHCLGNMLTEDFKDIWYGQRHWEKIRGIDRHECSKVDCKFFSYHDQFNEADKVGSVYFV